MIGSYTFELDNLLSLVEHANGYIYKQCWGRQNFSVLRYPVNILNLLYYITGITHGNFNIILKSSFERLLSRFGLTKLKYKQKMALIYFLSGRDVFVNLPIGISKSLIYRQFAPLNDCCTAFVWMLWVTEETNTFGSLLFPKFHTISSVIVGKFTCSGENTV